MSDNMTLIERLRGRDNYATWKFAVRTYLEHEDLWGVVSGSATAETADAKKDVASGSATAQTVDAKKDVKARSKIVLLVDPTLYIHVQEAKTANECWSNLSKAFDDSGLTRRVGLLRDLITTTLDSCQNIEDYVYKILTTAHKLRNIGFSVDDEWLGTVLLAGLPESYRPMIMAIESSGVAITADLIKTKLLQEVKDSDTTIYF